MLNGCGAHLLRWLQQGYALLLCFADEFTRASGPRIQEYAPVRFALRHASGLPHLFNTRLLRAYEAGRAGAGRRLFGFWQIGQAQCRRFGTNSDK